MDATTLSARILRAKATVISTVFLGLIFLPALDTLFHLDHAPVPNEKRLLATFPQYQGLGGLKDFLSGLNAYFDDHFGFRKRLIRANNHWKRQLFGEPPHNDVVIGRDGWLFFIGGRTLDNYFGLARFRDEELEAWRQLLEKRRAWLAKRGIKYVFAMAPDKHTVYPEYLPQWFIKSPKPGKPEQLFAYMREHSDVPVLDLHQPVREAKSAGTCFLKTDTHWNLYGAFIGCQKVIEALAQQVPELKALPIDAFDWKRVTGPGGDLAAMLGDSNLRETEQVVCTPRPPLGPLLLRNVPERLRKKWRQGSDPVASANDRGQGKALVFRDSFANAWKPFLGYHFREVIFVWQHEWDTAFIEREKPDVVIDEVVERFFNEQDPMELMRKDNL
jgi:alginate O-acetyltransferase complex protein AlgJ